MTLELLKDDPKREQALLTLFPAALILAVYAVVFALPLRQTKTVIETEYMKQKLVAVAPETTLISRRNLENEKESLDRINKRVANSKQQIRELSQSWRSEKSRLETLEKLTELMRDYNLSIVSQGGDSEVVVSSYLQDLFLMLNEQAVLNPVEFWPVEIKGAYFDVLEFLTDVDTLAKSIIPVAVTMRPEAEGSSQKTWTIVFVN
ncbi:MAG: hypothetical protein P8J27_17695 [Mariniblastus sp.]|nr:hypothetical protein [Mariniblastus sp.]